MTLRCADAPGIVHATSEAIVAVGGNILENDQFTDPVTGQFCMRTRFETEQGDVDAVRAKLEAGVAKYAPVVGLRLESRRRRALVMVSSADHCLADLLYRAEQGDLALDLVAVVSNHGDCRALSERHGVPFYEIAVTPTTKVQAEARVRDIAQEFDVDLIVLARYMQILSSEFCDEFAGQIVNIHHSFLPGFKGARPYHQAYERGVKLIGATAHFVTGELDEGPIIEQDVVRVSHARRPQDLVALGRDIERTVLARAVSLLAEDRVMLVGARTVIFAQ
ncbi:MAG: formyltetrahydrofolate deformylase [Acidobacteriota bacterium]|nr:formyltetrahydrofolate deformylase [Acidobacteriota bacterium]MDE3043526.1 formyltetrahydrofolate deformylase [Acidobacteriota bacterium]MDE3106629.1 formyltetrahydrofolate deformylase [Acidobacteriota bacterium]MDE3223375.1 formyltetrahydrofolate deformylase [Acidobacteriota bacterium]